MKREEFEDHISRGISLMAAENFQEAKEQFQAAVALDGRSFDAYTDLGNACASLEQYDEALTAFKDALLLKPDSGPTLYSIGNIYLLQNDRLNAVRYYNRAEEAGFKRVELYQNLVAIFLESGDVTQALRNVNRAISIAPLDGDLWLHKARILLTADRLDEAIEVLDEMQKVFPDAFEAYDLRAQILCGQKKYEEALSLCEQGCKRFPEDANLAMAKLRVLVEMEQDEQALAWLADMKASGAFEKVLKTAAAQEAILYLRKQDAAKAEEILEDANKRLNGDADILNMMLNIYTRTSDYEKVLAVSDRLVEMGPNVFYDSAARYYHAHALYKLGRDEQAKEEFKALTIRLRRCTIDDPSFYEGYIFRLLSHTHLGEYEKALELAAYLENLYPERADSHAFRYYIYKTQGDTEKAEAEKAQAHQIDPDMRL